MEKITYLQLEHLINFALNKKSDDSDSCVIALSNGNESNFYLQYYLDNKICCDFVLNNVDDGFFSESHQKQKRSFVNLSVDFSIDESENVNLTALKNHIAKKLPIVEIINLIGFALECNVITDVSVGKTFASYEYDYAKICSSNSVFEFTIDGLSNRDIKYGVTFSKELYKKLKKDPKSKVEYASRATQFVDILIKRVMSKYNILTVPQASVRFDDKSIEDYLKTLYLHKNFESSGYDSADDNASDTETNSVQNQVKVLIRYQDTVNATSFCEDVIDDVYISCTVRPDETGVEREEICYVDLLKIDAAESNDKKLGVARVNPIELKNIRKIKDFVESKKEKLNIFNYLREKPDSNLAKLINRRKKLYKEEYQSKNENGEEKKPIQVDFTITPISIFSNHVVKKIIACNISFKKNVNPLLQNFSLKYSTSFNPLEVSTLSYTVDGKKDGSLITKENPLVIAIKNDFIKNPNNIEACLALESDTVNLHEIWSKESKNNQHLKNKFYLSENYQNVFFHKDAIVYLDENGKKLDQMEKGAMPYLKSDIGRCIFSNTYAHVSLLDSIDKSRVFPKNKISDKDLVDGKVYYNGAKFTHYCQNENCNEKYASTDEDWFAYIGLHTAVNTVTGKDGKKLPNIVCCDKCRHQPHKVGNQTLYIFKNFKGELFADTENLKHVSRCPACIDVPFINTNDLKIKGQGDYVKCDICNHYYCKNHVKQYSNGQNVCIICNPVNDPLDNNCIKIHPNSFDNNNHKQLWKKIYRKLKASDRKTKISYFVVNSEVNRARNELNKLLKGKELSDATLRFENELRVTVIQEDYRRIYFFVCDDKKKNYILKKVSKKIKEV